jgi:hypothetical protein
MCRALQTSCLPGSVVDTVRNQWADFAEAIQQTFRGLGHLEEDFEGRSPPQMTVLEGFQVSAKLQVLASG